MKSKKLSKIISQEDQEINKVIMEFQPEHFTRNMDKSAHDFLDKKIVRGNDFQISEIASEQAGILQLENQKMNLEVEKKTLLKLKEVEEKAYKEAYELGLVEGTEKAFSEKSQEINANLERLKNLFSNLENSFSDVLSTKESTLVELLYLMASKIAQFEITSNRDKIVDLMRELVEELQSSERVVIRISPDDFKFVQTLMEKENQDLDFLKRVKLESSAEVVSGGCFLETNSASIDATLGQRVRKLKDVLNEKKPLIINDQITQMDEEENNDPEEGES